MRDTCIYSRCNIDFVGNVILPPRRNIDFAGNVMSSRRNIDFSWNVILPLRRNIDFAMECDTVIPQEYRLPGM
jgi:hypothetical protein